MSSCFGSRKARSKDADTDPLLAQYDDDTSLQRELHQKLHSYQMVRALRKGYMPATDQLIINLRTFLASDVLNPDNPDLSDSGRLLVKLTKEWLMMFIDTLRHKNGEDQIQDFIWYLSKSRISVDTTSLANSASQVKAKADSAAAYNSLKTVGSLLLTNSDFRMFLSDLNVIGRQVFADTATTVSEVAKNAAKTIEPSEQETDVVKSGGTEPAKPPTTEELNGQAKEVGGVLVNGMKKTGHEAASSLVENVTGEQKETLLHRLKAAVTKLRRRNDYTDSVATIGKLLQRYSMVYSRAADQTIGAVQDDISTNSELDRAIRNFWSLLSSFGDSDEWKKLEQAFNAVLKHSQSDPDFENLMKEVAASIQKLLTDPDFFEAAGQKFGELKDKTKEVGTESSLRVDINTLMAQTRRTFSSVMEDADISNLIDVTAKLIAIVSPLHTATNPELVTDALNVFIPLAIQAIQYIPIPRLEISSPDIDLLLENLILEPGVTVNKSSFLPFRLRIETQNDLEVRKALTRTVSKVTSLVTIKLDGLSIRGSEIGYWLRLHSGLLRFADVGIASFFLDDRGLDIHLDVEVGRDRLDKILSLRGVRVKIHHLNYTLRKSKLACLAWCLKPLVRPILRKVIEVNVAHAIEDFLRAANRELLFARERLRATRISDPQDIRTFIKAVITRLTPEDDPDLFTSVGVKPSGNDVFKGVYAPGSIVKLWEDEAAKAGEIVDDSAGDSKWRNEIFDVQNTATVA
ncbi:MAG: hypothetical protein M1814_003735 [Vezdaea aestivalis]|nr:MAG: hypothetical protein M1814_003735 [Vezdaea aestivalis]